MLLPRLFYYLFPAIFTIVVIIGLGQALSVLAASFLLAYLSFPLILKLEEFKIRRPLAALCVLFLLLATILMALAFVLPPLLTEARLFFLELPNIVRKTHLLVEQYAARWGYSLNVDAGVLSQLTKEYASTLGLNAIKGISTLVTGTFNGVVGILINLMNLLLFPIFFFHVTNDYENIKKSFWSFIPQPWYAPFRKIAEECNDIFRAFIRGQLIVVLFLSTTYALGLSLLKVPFGAVIGVLAGFLGLIPYLGSAIGILSALGVALAYGGGMGQLLAITALFGSLQTLEGLVITPKVVGDRVGLSPLWALIALIIGGNIGGLTGMFLAIPVGGICWRLLLRYKTGFHSNFDRIIR